MTDGDPAGELRAAIRDAYLAEEGATVARFADLASLSAVERRAISARAADLVRRVREAGAPGLMETFLAEYGLSTREGVALMCLAEALLRVPDTPTIDALIQDKIVPADWGRHLGHASSSLVNASTWALLLTGRVLSDSEPSEGLVRSLRGVVRRLGEPVVRTAVAQAMRRLGSQFVLGRTIEEAAERARRMEERGYTYSYDMLGEAARTDADARRYHLAYSDAITALADQSRGRAIRTSPGISVKLSALHPRYEFAQRETVLAELVPRAASLAQLARSAEMGFNIDAEEADRLDLSLDVIEALLSDRALAGWDGFGVVVQAYGPRAIPVLDWLHALAERHDRRIMVRLVKGAYWDTEIKRAQVAGLAGFPVLTRKVSTDASYIACARRLLEMRDRIYPQFATHNAHTLAAVLHMAGSDREGFEFQRLHGMGEVLHDLVRAETGVRCRVYAPVGAHRDLLAYLVRRLLENGANSSFVNQIVDDEVPPEEIAQDPFDRLAVLGGRVANPAIPRPADIFGPERRAAKGWDLTDPSTVAALEAARAPFRSHRWTAAPLLAGSGPTGAGSEGTALFDPAHPAEVVGRVRDATRADIEAALAAARGAFQGWSDRPAAERCALLERVADLYEANAPELMALAAREAGKTPPDAVAEVREAVDFCRYYAAEMRRLEAAEPGSGRGVFVCISPWNFPLAIFTGQVAAALVGGNAVIAKPAEQTPLIAARAVALMHEAGVPAEVVQLLPGDGPGVGAALVSSPDIAGVCFTGSTETARAIHRAMAASAPPDAPLIAETGGLNAMIVDSTALPEQAVRDILASAFQSAGQRCSALRVLYLQEDVADRILEMLFGAMDALRLGDPWALSTDIGPVIDAEAERDLTSYCAAMTADGRLLKALVRPKVPAGGRFVPPHVFRVSGIEEVEREVFGPVLHVARFRAKQLDRVVDAINARGYGLTFGLHTRVDRRVQQVVDRIRAGNVYVNRNQIGAVVGSQPFGGEGLSGTGPKAGGPHYLPAFRRRSPAPDPSVPEEEVASDAAPARQALGAVDARPWARRRDRLATLARAVDEMPDALAGPARAALEAARAVGLEPETLPGPTGESNRLSVHPRGVVLCLGRYGARDPGVLAAQAVLALATGNGAVLAAPESAEVAAALQVAGAAVVPAEGPPPPSELAGLEGFEAVAAVGSPEALRACRRALASREGALLPLVTEPLAARRFVIERAVCVDTTAAGGNAALLAAAGREET